MGDELHWQSLMFDMFILDRELHSLEPLELKFGLSSEFFDKMPVRILLDVLFRVFRLSKAIFLCPGIFIHDILKLRRLLSIASQSVRWRKTL